MVSYLTEELVRQGHEVTLFASGDSATKARLVAPCRRSLRLDKECVDQLAHRIVEVELVLKHSSRFDIIHFHIDYLHFSLLRRQTVPYLTTLHGRLDIPDLVPLYQEFTEVPVSSISDAQREPLPWLNWQGTVYHGLPEDLYRRLAHGCRLSGCVSATHRGQAHTHIHRIRRLPWTMLFAWKISTTSWPLLPWLMIVAECLNMVRRSPCLTAMAIYNQ